MRIWSEKLIPRLCQKHLCAMWREGLGCYKIITEEKNGYKNHPAVKEFEDCPDFLWLRLAKVREEMLKRNYHPKALPSPTWKIPTKLPKEWQSLEQQVEILKAKGCKCQLSLI